MKWLLLLSFFLCSCAETRIYDDGRLLAVVQGDATNVTVRGRCAYFHADVLNHSAATAAGYTGGTALVGGIGAAVVSGLIAKP